MLYQFFIDANQDDKQVSSKGLYLLFTLGFIPLFLGVTVESFRLDIPWLVSLSVKNMENSVIIYSSVVLFSVYRFYTRNRIVSVEFLAICFMNFYDSSFGKAYINKLTYEGNFNSAHKHHSEIYSDKKFDNMKIVTILNYEYHNGHQVGKALMIKFFTYGGVTFNVFNFSYPIKEAFAIHENIGGFILEKITKKGNESGFAEVKSGRFNSFPESLLFIYIKLRYGLLTSIKNLDVFDFYAPILVNLFLVKYLISNIILKTV
jgi:hypothetical protein